MAAFEYDRDLWMQCLAANGYCDEIPIDLEEFLKLTNKSARELLNMFYYGKSWIPYEAEKAREKRKDPNAPANPNADLIAFDGYGNAITLNECDLDQYLMECVTFEAVKEWAVDEGIFEEEEEEEEEEEKEE